MDEENPLNEKQDSNKIAKTSKGYKWEIKRYFDFERKRYQEVIRDLKEIDKELGKEFEAEKCKSH